LSEPQSTASQHDMPSSFEAMALMSSTAVPDDVIMRLWDGIIGYGSRAIDVGARRGEAIPLIEAAGYTSITALEPHEISFGWLMAGFSRYDCRQIALSSHNGTVKLAKVPVAMDKGELVTPGLDGMEWSPDSWHDVPLTEVPCLTLDQLVKRNGAPDLVLIDTEGHEAEVLKGAAETIRTSHAHWLVEFHSPQLHKDVIELLSSGGYEPETLRHPHYRTESQMWHQHGWVKARPVQRESRDLDRVVDAMTASRGGPAPIQIRAFA
jgi:FkbM family methyltransferase